MEDFKAKFGKYNTAYGIIMGTRRLGQMNENC